MLPILILSLIIFTVGFILNKNNAKYLLSGYNTMSDVEKEHYDLEAFLKFNRKFHLFLSISLFVVASILHYFVSSIWSGIFLVLYPLLMYIFYVYKSSTYNKNKKKYNTIIIFLMFVFLFYIIFDFSKTLKDNQILISTNSLEITGEYGTIIKKDKIKFIKLVASYPEISYKTDGFTLGDVKKGKYITNKKEEVKLLINSDKTPLILIITKDNQEIYYSSKNKSNQEIYKELICMLKNTQNLQN